MPERTQVNACAHRGLAGWGLASADGRAVWFKRRRSALAAGHGFAGGVFCKFEGGFQGAPPVSVLDEPGRPPFHGQRVVLKRSGLGRLRAQGAGQQRFGRDAP